MLYFFINAFYYAQLPQRALEPVWDLHSDEIPNRLIQTPRRSLNDMPGFRGLSGWLVKGELIKELFVNNQTKLIRYSLFFLLMIIYNNLTVNVE